MSIADNLESVREKVAAAERRAGRAAGSVRLMAVSKFNPAESVLEAIASGQLLFGENRVQEASDKFTSILPVHPATELHLIGSLQRNKVKQIVPLAACIQSVDRPELLAEIEKQASSAGKTIKILFEMHTGEESKAGFPDRDSLFRAIDTLEGSTHVSCAGLMTMAPFSSDRDLIRSSFRALVSIQRECALRYPAFDFSVLSMGMSADFDIAIEEGSTLVRIGTAIFGART